MDHITIGKKPQTLGAISTPISALIGDKLKQLIWKDQYIDLAPLTLLSCQSMLAQPQHSVLLMMTGPFELLSWVPYSFPFGIGQVLLYACMVWHITVYSLNKKIKKWGTIICACMVRHSNAQRLLIICCTVVWHSPVFLKNISNK
jgi:hypothetical protein